MLHVLEFDCSSIRKDDLCNVLQPGRKKQEESSRDTPNGSRTRAACLEGKHDNRFTIGVTFCREPKSANSN